MSRIEEQQNIFLIMHPGHRVLVGAVLATAAFFLIHHHSLLLRLMITWDVFAFVFCITSLIVFFTRSTGQIKKIAITEDGSRAFIILILLLASFASLIMVLLLMLSDVANGSSKVLYSIAAVSGMMLSWTMVHTTFAFHYAHLYYMDHITGEGNFEGLEFPGEKNPDYLDFAYFSFVIGMTFQVSDVEINDRIIRRLCLLHSLLSFLLNTFVVALTINLIAGLRN